MPSVYKEPISDFLLSNIFNSMLSDLYMSKGLNIKLFLLGYLEKE